MTLSAFIYADGGAGKSFVGPGTSPGPVLVVDTESGIHKMPQKHKVQWDFKSGKYPEITPDTVWYVVVEGHRDLDAVISALHTEKSPFKSFWIDSYTVYAKMVDYEVIGTGSGSKDSRQDYKKLLRVLEPQIIQLNHILSRTDRQLEVIGYTAWQQSEKVAPAITGGVSQLLNHSCDIVGQVAITFDSGKLGQTLHIMPTRGVFAKAPGQFYKKYGEQLVNPDFTQLHTEMNNG